MLGKYLKSRIYKSVTSRIFKWRIGRKGVSGRLQGQMSWSENTGRISFACGLEKGMTNLGQAEF